MADVLDFPSKERVAPRLLKPPQRFGSLDENGFEVVLGDDVMNPAIEITVGRGHARLALDGRVTIMFTVPGAALLVQTIADATAAAAERCDDAV